ncbi:MAG: protein kinase [Lentisphaeria bacterium]|nr:protein kinase [Lentisphaeria bacterium]
MPEYSPESSRDLEATQIINMADNNETIQCQVESTPLSEEELKQKIIQPDWGKLKSSFTNLSVLGFGGMGTVFKAKDTLFYRNLALKVMRSDLKNDTKSIDSFIREARITAQIDHPNIIPVYNLGVFEGTGAYFSMKKVDGEDLEYVLKRLEKGDQNYIKKYPLHRRLEIFLNICNGMLFAHSKGIIHRDLKPANIMIGNYGEVFIMDWGMAIYIEKNDSSNKKEKIDLREKEDLPNKNSIAGTPLFMSPEQIAGCEIEYGEASDVYALGNILYCLLCCVATPHNPKLETKELFSIILNGEIVLPHKRSKHLKISRELEAICMKALAVERVYRYKNVAELMNDIKNYLNLQVVGVYNSPIIRFFKFCRRHPLIPSTLLVALLTMGVFFSYFYIKDAIELKALKQVLTQNLHEAETLLAKQMQLIQRSSRHNAQTDIDYIKLEMLNQNTALLNETRLASTIQTLLDTLNKISLLSGKLDIGQEKEQILRLIISYTFNNIQDDAALLKILHISSIELTEEFEKMISKTPQLKEQLELLNNNQGKIILNSPHPLTLSCTIYNQENHNDSTKSEDIYIETPSELKLEAGTYVFSYKNSTMDTISVPLKVEAGKISTYNLLSADNIPSNMIYIPGGEYHSRILSQADIGHKRYIDDFFICKSEVTFGEYLEFWNSIEDPAKRDLFRGNMILEDSKNGLKVTPLWDDSGSLIYPLISQMPIFGISPQAAEAYCEYMSKKLNKKCRLPYFGEIEKAARGVDKRIYIWGDKFMINHALLNSTSNKKDYPYGAPSNSYPDDTSVYGVKELAGNLRELIKISGTDYYGIYGGSYLTDHTYAKCSTVSRFNGGINDVGFRYIIEMDKK